MRNKRGQSRGVSWLIAAATACLSLTGQLAPACAAPPAPKQAADPVFDRQIKPILTANCMRCHAGRKIKGNLDLSTRDKLMAGGRTGPAVVPGKPAESLLIDVLDPGGTPHMPPKQQLPPAAIAELSKWIGGLQADNVPPAANQQLPPQQVSPRKKGEHKKRGQRERRHEREGRERDED
ncbi:MAG: c-type cytochrome domain-containing protein [Gemmataceae bacterium]